MNWSETAWEHISPLYEKIINMPFNQELLDGTLPLEKFRFYMAQDAHYLLEFGKTLSTISGRMNKAADVLAFSEFASGAIVVERALHESYFQEFGMPEVIAPSPTCILYTQFLLTKAAYGNLEEAVAAVLPCFWIYKKVGDHIYANQKPGQHNPYKRWIDTYSGKEFAEGVEKAILITDQLANRAGTIQRKSMDQAFEMASKLEWMFWDSAYRMEAWPV